MFWLNSFDVLTPTWPVNKDVSVKVFNRLFKNSCPLNPCKPKQYTYVPKVALLICIKSSFKWFKLSLSLFDKFILSIPNWIMLYPCTQNIGSECVYHHIKRNVQCLLIPSYRREQFTYVVELITFTNGTRTCRISMLAVGMTSKDRTLVETLGRYETEFYRAGHVILNVQPIKLCRNWAKFIWQLHGSHHIPVPGSHLLRLTWSTEIAESILHQGIKWT